MHDSDLTCPAVPCPANSNGLGVPFGCTCAAGFNGTVLGLTSAPFFTSTCSAVPCPVGSTGSSVLAGCTCAAGTSGIISPIVGLPFYSSTCAAVPCPALTNGVNVPAGCVCNTGYSGIVTATASTPFYLSTCAPTWVTASGSLATVYDASRSTNVVSVSATPSATVSYSLLSGSLPAGASLNAPDLRILGRWL